MPVKTRTIERSRPPKESNYTEQEDDENPRMKESRCENCYHFEENTRTTEYLYTKRREKGKALNIKGKKVSAWSKCMKWETGVDEIFGSCDDIKMVGLT